MFYTTSYTTYERSIYDMLIFGTNEDNFWANTHKVFQCCHERNVTLNAKNLNAKIEFDTIPFVGHDIDAKGINMSQKRIESTITFCKPTSLKELQSFMVSSTTLRTTCVIIPRWLNHYTTWSHQPQNKKINHSHGRDDVTWRSHRVW